MASAKTQGFYWVIAGGLHVTFPAWQIGYWNSDVKKWTLWEGGDSEYSPDTITRIGPRISEPDEQ